MFTLLLTVLLLWALAAVASAVEVPDLSRSGSISVTLRDTETKQEISGGTLTLYQVGTAEENDGDYSFALTGAFADSGISISDVQSEDTAKRLADYAKKSKISGTTASVQAGGVKFADLETGLYLIVQETAADGYSAVSPFLVTVPIQEKGSYVYDVDASPKTSVQRTTTPQQPVTPPKNPTLPQTGQLNWPVPVLTIAGLLLFAAGWTLCFGKRKHAK